MHITGTVFEIGMQKFLFILLQVGDPIDEPEHGLDESQSAFY